jgi:hypothetical protein
VAGIRVGTPEVKPDAPAHVRGINEGNEGPTERQAGFNADGTSTAARSTGINPKLEDPILPGMPNLSPP